MTQGFSPYPGDSFGVPSGSFPGADPGAAPAAGSSGPRLSRATSAPVLRLLPSLVCGVISLVLSVVITFGGHQATDTSFAVLAFVAWALAGVVGITALGWYFSEDNERRGSGLYLEVDWKRVLYWATVVVLVIAVIWSAVNIAQWAGKL